MKLGVIIVLVLLIVAVAAGFAWCPWIRRHAFGAGARERYGPPPGAYRALSHEELDGRGWVEFPFEFHANTASALSHMVERSA